MAIKQLPKIEALAATAFIAVSANGIDARIPFSQFPASPLIQVQIDDLQEQIDNFDGGGGGTSSEIITGLTVVDAEDSDPIANNAAMLSFFNTQAAGGGVMARIGFPGTYMFAGMFDVLPQVSFINDARGNVILQAGDNMLATNPDGADNSLIRVPARTHDVGGTLSYVGEISGLNLQGRRDFQSNPIIGIRMSNPDPDDNPFDPDPGFTTNKDYAATRLRALEITGFSGDGIVIEAGRGRCWLVDVRCLGNGGAGANIKSNDMVVGDRCGFGGNDEHGLLMGSGSGGLVHDVNAWTSPNTRGIGSSAIKFSNTSGFSIRGCMINDFLLCDGRNEKRPGTVVANILSPHDEIFESDGFAFDNDGGASPLIQAHVTVRGYRGLQIAHNTYTRTKKVDFATPSNVGGALDGTQGTAFNYCVVSTDDAEIAVFDTFSSRPNYRPWASADTSPFLTSLGGKITYVIADPYTGVVRIGAQGSGFNSHVVLATDESVAPDLNFAVQIGRTNKRNQINGATEFSHAVLYTDDASDVKALVNGDNFAINSQKRVQFISCTGTIAAATVTLPTGMNGSKSLDVIFTGNGVITAFTVSGTFASGSMLPPTKINGRTVMRFFYRHDNTSWYLVAVQSPSNPFIVIPYAATLNSDANVGTNFQVTLTGAAGLSVPTNAADGQAFAYLIIQDGTGGRVLTPGLNWEFEGGAPTFNTDANSHSMILGIYHAGLGKMLGYGSTSKFSA